MQAYIHEVTLSGDSEFSQRFNYVSWLFKKHTEADTDEEKEKWSKEHFEAKLALEQGYPINFLTEYSNQKLIQ